ncbi:MAG: hypothetical protein SFV23_14650 [Planctomycetaceae bacterium]|nr:hypothetical protein [Planctomycetaceae bacterium]
MTTAFHDHQQVEASRSSARLALPHSIECEVSHRLQQVPELEIETLVVRRTPCGVCLEGRIEVNGDVDIPKLLRGIPGLDEVINHLVVVPADPKPRTEAAPWRME